MRLYYSLLIVANVMFVPLLLLHRKTRWVLTHVRGLWLAPLICLPLFFTWDTIGIWAGWWRFNHSYLTNIMLFNVPVEEVLFLYLIPFATLFIWVLLRPRRRSR